MNIVDYSLPFPFQFVDIEIPWLYDHNVKNEQNVKFTHNLYSTIRKKFFEECGYDPINECSHEKMNDKVMVDNMIFTLSDFILLCMMESAESFWFFTTLHGMNEMWDAVSFIAAYLFTRNESVIVSYPCESGYTDSFFDENLPINKMFSIIHGYIEMFSNKYTQMDEPRSMKGPKDNLYFFWQTSGVKSRYFSFVESQEPLEQKYTCFTIEDGASVIDNKVLRKRKTGIIYLAKMIGDDWYKGHNPDVIILNINEVDTKNHTIKGIPIGNSEGNYILSYCNKFNELPDESSGHIDGITSPMIIANASKRLVTVTVTELLSKEVNVLVPDHISDENCIDCAIQYIKSAYDNGDIELSADDLISHNINGKLSLDK